MAESIFALHIEPQLDFPTVDLTDANASQLELLLANKTLVKEGRAEAERAGQTQVSFNVNFNWRTTIGWPLFRHPGGKAAFHHGISAYQTMGQLVRPFPDYDDPRVLLRVEELRAMSSDELKAVQTAAWIDFDLRQPMASEIIRSTSERFYPGLGSFAVYGAAVTRQLEIEASELAPPQPMSWLESVLK